MGDTRICVFGLARALDQGDHARGHVYHQSGTLILATSRDSGSIFLQGSITVSDSLGYSSSPLELNGARKRKRLTLLLAVLNFFLPSRESINLASDFAGTGGDANGGICIGAFSRSNAGSVQGKLQYFAISTVFKIRRSIRLPVPFPRRPLRCPCTRELLASSNHIVA